MQNARISIVLLSHCAQRVIFELNHLILAWLKTKVNGIISVTIWHQHAGSYFVHACMHVVV